jgi:hypothetical protein
MGTYFILQVLSQNYCYFAAQYILALIMGSLLKLVPVFFLNTVLYFLALQDAPASLSWTLTA